MGMGKEAPTVQEVRELVTTFDSSLDEMQVTEEIVEEMGQLIEEENQERMDAVMQVLEEEEILDVSLHDEFVDHWNGTYDI